MNRMTVIGRIVRETELKVVGDERMVLNNTIAITRQYRSETGQETDFLNFVAWGKRAELIEKYCDKGDLIALDGRIQSRTYKNDKEDTVYITEMLVESVYFLSSQRKKYEQNGAKSKANGATTQNETSNSTQSTKPVEADNETSQNIGHSNHDNPRNNHETVSKDEIYIDHIENANN